MRACAGHRPRGPNAGAPGVGGSATAVCNLFGDCLDAAHDRGCGASDWTHGVPNPRAGGGPSRGRPRRGGRALGDLQVIATTTLAAYTANYGLGRFLYTGLKTRDYAQMIGGAIVVVALALATDALLAFIARRLRDRTHLSLMKRRTHSRSHYETHDDHDGCPRGLDTGSGRLRFGGVDRRQRQRRRLQERLDNARRGVAGLLLERDHRRGLRPGPGRCGVRGGPTDADRSARGLHARDRGRHNRRVPRVHGQPAAISRSERDRPFDGRGLRRADHPPPAGASGARSGTRATDQDSSW